MEVLFLKVASPFDGSLLASFIIACVFLFPSYIGYSASMVVLSLKLTIHLVSSIISLQICSQSLQLMRQELSYITGVGCTVTFSP